MAISCMFIVSAQCESRMLDNASKHYFIWICSATNPMTSCAFDGRQISCTWMWTKHWSQFYTPPYHSNGACMGNIDINSHRIWVFKIIGMLYLLYQFISLFIKLTEWASRGFSKEIFGFFRNFVSPGIPQLKQLNIWFCVYVQGLHIFVVAESHFTCICHNPVCLT